MLHLISHNVANDDVCIKKSPNEFGLKPAIKKPKILRQYAKVPSNPSAQVPSGPSAHRPKCPKAQAPRGPRAQVPKGPGLPKRPDALFNQMR